MDNLAVDEETVGEAFHSALGKVCYSKPTSALWHILNVADAGLVRTLYDHIWDTGVRPMSRKKIDKGALAASVRSSAEDWSWSRACRDYVGGLPASKKRNHCYHFVIIIDCAIKMMNHEDWIRATWYFYPPEEE